MRLFFHSVRVNKNRWIPLRTKTREGLLESVFSLSQPEGDREQHSLDRFRVRIRCASLAGGKYPPKVLLSGQTEVL
jgi:hypothetical protein